MDSKFNKNFSTHSIRTTCQELQLRQLFYQENISFEFQKQYSLPDRQYVVDFLLPQQTILECSFTKMDKYHVAFRNKAITLEAKSYQLKKYFPDLNIWVLLETHRSILEMFHRTLIQLMPSVDQIFFSQNELREFLHLYRFSSMKSEEVVL